MTNPSTADPDLTDNTQSALRASDADREQAANLLRDHCAEGRIDPDELAERLDRAYRASSVGDLNALFDDLPRGTSSTLVKPRRALSPRMSRRLIAIPIAATIATLAAGADAHLLWLAWPLLAVYRAHHRPQLGRRSLAAGR